MPTLAFDPTEHGPVLAGWLSVDRRRPLDRGTPSEPAEPFSVARAFEGLEVRDRAAAEACLAGLWLLHDQLDRSHAISQQIETPLGSLWHAVMHRREGDYSNAKYWLARGASLTKIEAQLAARLGRPWEARGFVDRVQAAVERGVEVERCLDEQQAEWETLFRHSFRQALGGDPNN